MTTNDSKAWLHCGTEVVQRAMPIAEAKSRARLKHLERIHSQLDFELRIAPVAIIDQQLPFEYTITSRSTDVVVMAQPVQNKNHSAFRSMFEREKLSGNNFTNWFRQLKLVLRVEKKISMTYELHRQFENSSPYDMIKELKAMFEKQAGVERFDLIQTFHACKQEEGKPVATYVIEMKGYVDQLERLGYMLPQDLIVGPILNGLTKYFAGFVRNYNLHNMGKTIGELHAMLIEYEKGLPKKAETPQVMMIKGGKIQKSNKKSLKAKGKSKANRKGKDKQVYISNPKNPKPSAKEHPAKDDTFHHYKEVGHCKRNCPAYLAELLKKKKQVGSASSSGIFTIELFAFPNKSWVYDTGCGTHICITNQGFREARKLKQGVLYLYMGNGVRSQVEAIGSYDLVLPNGLVICLDNCHYTRGVVLLHRLVENDDESFDQCVSCLSGKMTRKSFLHRLERATDLLGIIHTDVCGPLRHVSRQGASYFISFTDDYNRYGYVYLLKHKHKVFETFKVFKNEVENQLGKTIKALRSDRGGEYISQKFKDYLKACGIVQQLTPPYTPQHNGVSERGNRTLLDMECEALVKWDTLEKLQQRSFKCIFIGYPKEIMGYYFYFPLENKIVVARYAEFFEKNLITQEVSRRAMDLEEIQDEDTLPSEITSEIPIEVKGFEPPQEELIPVRRSERTHRAPDRLCLNVEAEEHSLGNLNEPTSYKAAMLDSESSKWIDAMNAEIQSMMDNMVWVLVDLPPGSRLVAKGYTQVYGVDYEETFSPVANIRAIRILISIAAFYDYEIWQMDVKTTFLNGYLDEDIYMLQPEGFVDPNHPRKVCKLQRSIYGLKQALRSRNKRFDEEIKRFSFDQNLDEPCVYRKASGSNVTFLILYVDDIIIMGNHIPSLQSVKDYHGKCFAMKDLGEATFILGIKIYIDRNPEDELRVDCYCDAGFETDRDDTKSQTGYVFILNGGAMEAVWIMKFISGLGIVPTINEPIKIFYDNSAALLITKEPRVQMGTKHYHRSNLLKVHTDDNLAYPFTKALPKGKLTQHAKSMGLLLGKQVRFSFVLGFKKSDYLEYKVSNDDTAVAQRRLEDKQPEEKTNTDCLVKEREKVHLGIKVGANITVTGVPEQEGAEGNVAEKKKVKESMKANLGKLLKYNA
ncbi:retrotransposon protein, putative, ty1-copia subclass [Tanacetum coccineum]